LDTTEFCRVEFRATFLLAFDQLQLPIEWVHSNF
jgi:hypothetical protein